MGFGIGELLVVLFIVLLFFGSKKLPQLGSSIGLSLKNFKKAIEEKEEDKKDVKHLDEGDHQRDKK